MTRTTVEAVLQANGMLRFLEPVRLAGSQRVLVTFTQHPDEADDGARISEQSLAADWLRAEEDAAWAHLQTKDDVESRQRPQDRA